MIIELPSALYIFRYKVQSTTCGSMALSTHDIYHATAAAAGGNSPSFVDRRPAARADGHLVLVIM